MRDGRTSEAIPLFSRESARTAARALMATDDECVAEGRRDERVTVERQHDARACGADQHDEHDEHDEHGARVVDTRATVDSLDARVDRAERLFARARILRAHGLEVLGTELDPDWAYAGGNFDLTEMASWDDVERPRGDPLVPDLAHNALASDDERARVAASAVAPLERFHYRKLAARTAASAAELLPGRSHAYAAVLCRASSYVIDRDRDEADRIWTQYVTHGAQVEFAGTFGRVCPEPDFAGARTFDARRAALAKERGLVAAHRGSRHPRRDAARDVALLAASVLAMAAAGRSVARAIAGRGARSERPWIP
jgi:hypothetical protein